jgi:hypothetical protein
MGGSAGHGQEVMGVGVSNFQFRTPRRGSLTKGLPQRLKPLLVALYGPTKVGPLPFVLKALLVVLKTAVPLR